MVQSDQQRIECRPIVLYFTKTLSCLQKPRKNEIPHQVITYMLLSVNPSKCLLVWGLEQLAEHRWEFAALAAPGSLSAKTVFLLHALQGVFLFRHPVQSQASPRSSTIVDHLVILFSRGQPRHPLPCATVLHLVLDSRPLPGAEFLHSTTDELQHEKLEGTGTGLCLQTSNTHSRWGLVLVKGHLQL